MNEDISIEPYGDGFIIADYSEKVPTKFGARYCGISMKWREQPIVNDPFKTKEDAEKAEKE